MKKMFTSLLVLVMLSFTSSANVEYIIDNPSKSKHPKKVKTVSLTSACTATRSASHTVSGLDCNGLEFTITATRNCSRSAATCDEANSGAFICAWSLAVAEADASASAITEDCPAPIEP